MRKQAWLDAAEVFDTWRIVPRVMLFGYALFVYQVTMFLLDWYSKQAPAARGLEESGVVSLVIGAITGFAPWIFKIYIDGGRDWSSPPQVTTSTVTATKTVAPIGDNT